MKSSMVCPNDPRGHGTDEGDFGASCVGRQWSVREGIHAVHE